MRAAASPPPATRSSSYFWDFGDGRLNDEHGNDASHAYASGRDLHHGPGRHRRGRAQQQHLQANRRQQVTAPFGGRGMSDNVRLDDLRRRIEKDPASIAFAQLAEECRRLGRHQEAVDICRQGSSAIPVICRRASRSAGRFCTSASSMKHNTNSTPSCRARRKILPRFVRSVMCIGAAATCRRRLTLYQAALSLAPNDPELERALAELSETLAQAENERENVRARKHLAALEQWLTAIHVTRAQRSA